MTPTLPRERRAELRTLHRWCGAPDRPRALLGLVPLGHLAVAPFVCLAAAAAGPRIGGVS